MPVKEIANSGFSFFDQLEEVFIPDSIKIIGSSAFSGCEKLKFVNMVDVETIDQNAFSMCDELKGVVIPASVTTVGPNLFLYSNPNIKIHALKSVEEVSAWNNWVGNSSAEVIFGASQVVPSEILGADGKITGYEMRNYAVNNPDAIFQVDYYSPTSPLNPYKDNGELLDDSKPIVALKGNAFNSKTILDSVYVGLNSMDYIRVETQAFVKAKIKNIYFSKNVYFANINEETGNEYPTNAVFQGCETEKIMLPNNNNMRTIDKTMFLNCKNLNSLSFVGSAPNVLPSYITSIGDEAFKGCISLDLTINNTVTSVGSNVFADWGEDQIVKVWFTENEDAPTGWNTDWYGGNGTPVYTLLPPAGSYKITYHLNVGDKWYTGTDTYKPESGATLRIMTNGYLSFSGWKVNSDFSGNTYTSIPANSTTGDKIYYAKANTIEYTMKFYINGLLYTTKTYTILDSAVFMPPLFYTNFNGWYTNKYYLGTKYSGFGQGSYGNVSFYATGTYVDPIYDPGPGPGGPTDPDFPGKLPPDIIIIPGLPGPSPYGGMSNGIGSDSELISGEEAVCETENEESLDQSEQESILLPEESEDDTFLIK